MSLFSSNVAEDVSSHCRLRPYQLRFELLEDRTVPATFNPTTAAQLIADVTTANSNGEADVIELGGATFTLTGVDNTTDGPNGLPSILADAGNALVIQNGVIERDQGAADFRLFHVASGADLTLSRVTVQGGLTSAAAGAGSYGGAMFNRGAVTISRSLFTDNQAFRFGGAILNVNSLTIEDSTFSGNQAQGGLPAFRGGAIDNGGSLAIRNSTLSGNITPGSGGAIYNAATITEILNTTITGNSAGQGGGITSGVFSTFTTLSSTIVAGNTAGPTNGPDLELFGTLTTATNNLIQAADGHTITNGVNGNIVGMPANLDVLQDNGGPTPTHLLLAGSPAIGAGLQNGLASDQRGFARPAVGPSIGAVEFDAIAPVADALNAPDVTVADAGATTYEFSLRFSDNQAIRNTSLGDGNVRVTGPNGFSQLATFVSQSPAGSSSSITATYRITPPGGAWDESDNGDFAVSVESSQVVDFQGNVVASGVVGTFNVNLTVPVPVPDDGAVILADGVLSVYFTFDDDVGVFEQVGNALIVTVNGARFGPFDLASIDTIDVEALSGDDVVRILDPISPSLIIDGGPGADTLDLSGVALDTTVVLGRGAQTPHLFSNIGAVLTGAGNDTFVVNHLVEGRINGGGGSNTLDLTRLASLPTVFFVGSSGQVDGLFFNNIRQTLFPLFVSNTVSANGATVRDVSTWTSTGNVVQSAGGDLSSSLDRRHLAQGGTVDEAVGVLDSLFAGDDQV